jgi:hypothetical protein
MTRALLLGSVLLVAACGNASITGTCADLASPPAACNATCNASSAAPDTCPTGFHCAANGKCDMQCTPTGNQCGDGASCTADGYCMSNGGGGGGPPIDADCPAAHYTAMPTTPSIQLLIDRSGSMLHNFADQNRSGPTDPEKYQTVQDALVGAQGVVTQLQDKVLFGATLFSADPNTACPTLKTTGRAMTNKTAIETLIAGNRPNPNANTPTPPSIDAVVADFTANKPPQGSPPAIVLATDGLPNQCGSQTSTQAQSVTAAKNAFTHGIKLFILGVGTIQNAAQHLQDMANAGQGVAQGQPNAKAYTATDPTQLAAAFQEIIRGVVSCDLTLSHPVNATNGQGGTVTLDGMNLTYGTDWTLDADGLTIHLLGPACDKLKQSANPMVDATFACGAVIL